MSKINSGGVAIPPTSLFDIVLYIFTFTVPIFYLSGWNTDMVQKFAFVFGTFALLGISFYCKKERKFRSKTLAFVVLWSLALLFVHVVRLSYMKEPFESYAIFAFASTGFIYLLCGSILLYLTVTYSRRFNIIYPILAINILNLFFVITQTLGIELIWLNMAVPCGVMGTQHQLKVFSALSIPILFNLRIKGIWYQFFLIPIFCLISWLGTFANYGNSFNGFLAVFLALLIYLRRTDQREKVFILGSIFLVLVLFNSQLFFGKVFYRLGLYLISIKEIIARPFLGHGFDNGLSMNLVQYKDSFCYRQNDYLNIARDLGLPFMLFLTVSIVHKIKNMKPNYMWVALITLMISSTFQTCMYYPRLAIWGIVLFGLLMKDNIERKNEYTSN